MLEFDKIYVDLNRVSSASGIVDSLGIIQCNSNSLAGTQTNPINLKQFREYLYFNHDINQQTFYLKGKTSLVLSGSSNIGKLGDDILFETPHNQKELKIMNWVDNGDLIKIGNHEPWCIIIDGVGGDKKTCNIVTNNDNVEFINGEIQAVGEFDKINFGFTIPVYMNLDIDDNSLSIVNFKLYTSSTYDLSNDVHQIKFNNYKNIYIINSILNNRVDFGSILINNCFVTGVRCYFINNIISRFKYLLGFSCELGNFVANIKESVFTESVGNFSIDAIINYYNIFNNYDIVNGNNKFNWGGSSALDASLMDLTQKDNFGYLDTGWNDITVSGITNTYLYDNTIPVDYCSELYRFTEYRDGIGALTFQSIGDVYLSAMGFGLSLSIVNISGSDVYMDLYSPSKYVWFFDDYGGTYESKTSSIPSDEGFIVTHLYSLNGIYKPYVEVFSKNSWYTKHGGLVYETGFDEFNFEIELLRTSALCNDGDIFVKTLNSNNVLSAYTFDEIAISAVNTTVYQGDEKIVKSCGVNFTPMHKNFSLNYYEDYDNVFDEQDYSLILRHTYKNHGWYQVYFCVQLQDNSIVMKHKNVVIHERPQKIYYVDLDKKYTKWIYKQTYIKNDFEIDDIDSNWDSEFIDNYTFTSINSKRCVTGNGMQKLIGDINYNFDLEFSFIRNNINSTPSVVLKNNNDDDVLIISWNYDNSVSFSLYGYVFEIPYRKNKNFGCANSLKELSIKIIHNERANIQVYLYEPISEQWEEHFIFSDNTFNSDDNILDIYVLSEYIKSGFVYFKFQSHCGLPYNNGDIANPLTYDEFVRMTTIEDRGDISEAMPTADYKSKFLMKNYRKVYEQFLILNYKYFEITGWNLNLYGPWMLIYDIHFNNPEEYLLVSFKNTKLSNGIIYNIREPNDDGEFVPNIEISSIYNMFIVWNTPSEENSNYNHGLIVFFCDEYTYNKNKRMNMFGSTIKSERAIHVIVSDGG